MHGTQYVLPYCWTAGALADYRAFFVLALAAGLDNAIIDSLDESLINLLFVTQPVMDRNQL